MIISVYAGGMTIRDIQHHLASTIGTDLSHETIANITDAVLEAVLEWQQRPLDARLLTPRSATRRTPSPAGRGSTSASP